MVQVINQSVLLEIGLPGLPGSTRSLYQSPHLAKPTRKFRIHLWLYRVE